jgi:hypothetical protein
VGDRPGNESERGGPVESAISTVTRGNSTAFGFSITITGTFGVLQTLVGSPTFLEVLMFGVAAAGTIAVIEAVVTRGFRQRSGVLPAEVRMLGTAQDFLSVAAAVAAAAGVGAVLNRGAAWPLAAAAATFVFIAMETGETVLAEVIQRRRGDPEADEEHED